MQGNTSAKLHAAEEPAGFKLTTTRHFRGYPAEHAKRPEVADILQSFQLPQLPILRGVRKGYGESR